ncbi:MAG: cell division protein FtsA [Candidatus Omnitrophica bacterium]|nr:cell division protein FtsA [Candidatus Omnitrophota bacterium]MCM8799202.1 cell division protein FtsA [Candidatus Omnitrophota bacterium]
MSNSYLCALDLGSSKIASCVAKLNKAKLVNLYFESIPSKGIRRSGIVDIQEASNSINKLLTILKKKSEFNFRSLYVGIKGVDVELKSSSAVIPLARGKIKLITDYDIRCVNEQARFLGSSLDYEILESVPLDYSVDDKKGISNPVGLYGRKLGVDLLLVVVKTSFLENIAHLFRRLGYEVECIFISSLVIGKMLIDRYSLKNNSFILCDIGADSTEVALFRNNFPQKLTFLDFGGKKFDESLSISLSVPAELAEEIKITYGSIITERNPSSDREVIIRKGSDYKRISKSKVDEVLTSLWEDFLHSFKEVILKEEGIDRIFVCGKTAILEGLLEKMEQVLMIPVEIAYPFYPQGDFVLGNNLSSSQSLNYLPCLGIIYEVINSLKEKPSKLFLPQGFFKKIILWLKEIYEEYF